LGFHNYLTTISCGYPLTSAAKRRILVLDNSERMYLMDIAGLQKNTLLDYPGKIACTVFLAGCNLRCPFCHNPSLVLPSRAEPPAMEESELLAFLKKRRGLLEGVCITGGEPTLHRDLPQL